MTYLDLVIDFWQKDLEYNFSDKEVALYFYLLKTCNYTRWKNPFGLSNAITIARFGWGKASFDTAKNNLKKAGLIDFKAGDGRGVVYQYEIKGVKKGIQKDTLYPHLSRTLSPHLSSSKPATSIDNKIEDKEEDNSETNVSGAGSVSIKKNKKKSKIESTEYWQPLVKIWFSFNEDQLKLTPSFKGSDPKDLKGIVDILKKRAVAKNFEWSEKHASDTLTLFLRHSYKDDWLKNNFLLSNLLKQFDKIITPNNEKGNTKNGKSDLTNLKSELAAELGNPAG